MASANYYLIEDSEDYYLIKESAENGDIEVTLTVSFDVALEANNGMGKVYGAWVPGSPLPNPCGNGWKGKPIDSLRRCFETSRAFYIDLSLWDTQYITDIRGMFLECENLFVLDLSMLNFNKVEKARRVFQKCHNLRQLDLSGQSFPLVDDIKDMFYGCDNLRVLDFSDYEFEKEEDSDIEELFAPLIRLEHLFVKTQSIARKLSAAVPESCQIHVVHPEETIKCS